MKVIILGAGIGNRLKPITDNMPKILVPVDGEPLIFYVLDSLPKSISEIIIVIGDFEEMIKREIGNVYKSIPIKFISQENKERGTAIALWAAKDELVGETFLVLNGDDIIDMKSLEKLIKTPLSFGIYNSKRKNKNFFNIIIDNDGNISDFERYDGDNAVRIATGSYVLDDSIFSYNPVKLRNNEYGLAQTILEMTKYKKVKAVEIASWMPVNSLEDLENAEHKIRSNKVA